MSILRFVLHWGSRTVGFIFALGLLLDWVWLRDWAWNRKLTLFLKQHGEQSTYGW